MVAIMVTFALSTVYTNWLWFQSQDLGSVYWRMVHARLLAGALFGLLAALLIAPNLVAAYRRAGHVLRTDGSPWGPQGGPADGLLQSRTTYWIAGLILVLFLARIGSGLSAAQKEDWKWFKIAWDQEMASEHKENWGGLFAQWAQEVVDQCSGGQLNAFSLFVNSETRRCFDSVPQLLCP